MKRMLWMLCLLPGLLAAGTEPGAAWRDYGLRLLNLRRAPEAADAFTRALKAAPRDAGAWAGLGNARWLQGRKDAALQAWRRSLQLRPDNAGLAAFVRRLEGGAQPAARADAPAEVTAAGPSHWWRRGLTGAFLGAGLAVVALF